MILIGTIGHGGTVAIQAHTGEEPLRASARPCGWVSWGGWLFDPHPLPPNPADPPSQFPKTPKTNRFGHKAWCVRLISYRAATKTESTFNLGSPYSILTYSGTGEPWDKTKTSWWRPEWGYFPWGDPGGWGDRLRDADPGVPMPTGDQLHELALRTEGPDDRRFYPSAPIPLPRRGWRWGAQFPNEGGFSPCRLEILMPPGTRYNLFVTATYYRKARLRGETGSGADRANVWIEVQTTVGHVAPPCPEGGG